METKINIAEILKNKPRGTKLYSIVPEECTLIKFGNMYDGGECIIFPSKEMRDWSKFSWKY